MTVFQEEIFGPVVTVATFKDYSEAIAIANDTIYGLVRRCGARDADLTYRASQDIQAGRVWVNTYHQYPAGAAFGGYKQSGYGRETDQQSAAQLPAGQERAVQPRTRSHSASSSDPGEPVPASHAWGRHGRLCVPGPNNRRISVHDSRDSSGDSQGRDASRGHPKTVAQLIKLGHSVIIESGGREQNPPIRTPISWLPVRPSATFPRRGTPGGGQDHPPTTKGDRPAARRCGSWFR